MPLLFTRTVSAPSPILQHSHSQLLRVRKNKRTLEALKQKSASYISTVTLYRSRSSTSRDVKQPKTSNRPQFISCVFKLLHVEESRPEHVPPALKALLHPPTPTSSPPPPSLPVWVVIGATGGKSSTSSRRNSCWNQKVDRCRSFVLVKKCFH